MILDQHGNKLKIDKPKPQKRNFSDRLVSYAGAGCFSDKSQSAGFAFNELAEDSVQLENVYTCSWSAAKIIDIPVDDMFVFPRNFVGHDQAHVDELNELETKLQLNEKIKLALKGARLYGTCFLLAVSDEKIMKKPLNIDSPLLSVKNIIVLTRFDASVMEYDKDITSVNYGKPLFYSFTLDYAGTIIVHYSRVVRVDGVKPISINRWRNLYNKDWGVSTLIRAWSSILNEETMSGSVNYLLQEASIPILKIPDLQDALAGAPDAVNADTLVSEINNLKSIYRTVSLDKEMDYTRMEASFDNIPDLFDKYYLRLSAAANIPYVRFFGDSPSGLNSTGNADMQNYAIMIASNQKKELVPIYDYFDAIFEKMLGINESVSYEFRPLLDLSDTDKAEVELKDSQRDQIYLNNGVVEVKEVRQKLSDEEVYSDLDVDKEMPVDNIAESDMINNNSDLNQGDEDGKEEDQS